MWLDGLMDNVVYALIFLFIGYSIYFYIIKSKEDEPNKFDALNAEEEDDTPVVQPPDDQLGEMTLDELKKYNGKDEKQILISVKNIIFDCTKNEMYQPGGSYHLFAGKDASVSLSRMSFEEKDMNIYNTEKLNLSELDILDQWFQKFNQKYLRIAKLVETKKDQ